jgi:hypothetical protein
LAIASASSGDASYHHPVNPIFWFANYLKIELGNSARAINKFDNDGVGYAVKGALRPVEMAGQRW